MLAALAMPRYPHPLGYTCIWLPPIDAPKAGKQDKRLMNLYTSKEWLEKAIHKLSVQDLPEPNPASDEYFSFEYDFTASTHQTFCIEIIDYSGELINPVISNSTLAKNLRKKFTTMDGILVLAEAPYRDRLGHVQSAQKSRDGQTHTDLYQLQQTFSLLRSEKQEGAALDFPVALLVNKWDRYSDIDYANPAKEQSKLEEFINSNPPPPHKGVHDVLRFSVAEGNFKMFPVSALGDNEFVRLDNGDVVEHPKQANPLNAFTLVDAFIWLAQRRDAIDFQQFVEKGTLNKKCKKTGLELLNSLQKNSEQAKQIHTILQSYQKTKTRRIISTLIAIVALLFVTETTMDFRNYHQHIVAINNPHTTHEQFDKAETWLTQYVAAPYFRHLISRVFLSSREQAQKTLMELQAHRDKFLWEPVAIALKANDLPAAKAPASEYLKYFPLGEHAQKAREIKLNAEIQPRESKKDWENFVKTYTDYMNNGNLKQAAKWLLDRKPETAELKQLKDIFKTVVIEKIADKVTLALKEARFEEAWRLLEEYANSPSSLQTVEGTQKIAVLRELVKTLVIKTIEEKITFALKEARFEEALGLLQGYANPSSSLQTLEGFSDKIAVLQKQVKTSAIKTIEQQVNIALKKARYDDALSVLKKYDNYPSSLRTKKGRKTINALQKQVNRNKDKSLYEQVRKRPNAVRIQKYLKNAPLKTMAKNVSAYKAYLDSTKPKAKLNIRLKLVEIHWKNVDDDDNTVSVDLKQGEKTRISNTYKVNAKPNTVTKKIGISHKFSATPSMQLSIKVKVVNESMMSMFNDDYGEGSVTMPVSKLAKGYYRMALYNEKKVKTATVYIQIIGYPTEPRLPKWRSSIK